MMEWKKVSGFQGSMTELSKVAGPEWDKLTPGEREMYRTQRYSEVTFCNQSEDIACTSSRLLLCSKMVLGVSNIRFGFV